MSCNGSCTPAGFEWRPAYAYLPGPNRAAPETLSDEIKNACAGCHYYEFRETATFDYAYSFLREGFYWESHEVFEVLWMACPDGSAEKTLLQGLIQLANMAFETAHGASKGSNKVAGHGRGLMDRGLYASKRSALWVQKRGFGIFNAK